MQIDLGSRDVLVSHVFEYIVRTEDPNVHEYASTPTSAKEPNGTPKPDVNGGE